MADGAEAIRGAAKELFEHHFTLLMCFFHAKKNVKTKINSKEYFKEEDEREIMREHLKMLHACPNDKFYKRYTIIVFTFNILGVLKFFKNIGVSMIFGLILNPLIWTI